MPRCLHPPGSRRQAVCRGGVHFTRNEFLAHAVPDSGRKTPAPDLSQKGLCLRQSATLPPLDPAFLPIHIFVLRLLLGGAHFFPGSAAAPAFRLRWFFLRALCAAGFGLAIAARVFFGSFAITSSYESRSQPASSARGEASTERNAI